MSRMEQLIFKCNITDYFIEMIIIEEKNVNNESEKIGHINLIKSDYKNLKALLNLLRTTIDKLSNLNIKKIRQEVYLNDWKEYLKDKTSFYIKDLKQEIIIIECKTEEFLENFGIGIGVLEKKDGVLNVI